MEKIEIKGGELILHPNFLSENEAQKIFNRLLIDSPWQEDEIRIFGKWVKQPRQTCIYADDNIEYSYSGLTQKSFKWPEYLLSLKSEIEKAAGSDFNLVLLNHYRDGQDSMGWHSDDEKELGENPVIASLSLGQKRRFRLRPKKTVQADPFSVDLENGSLLIMKGAIQHLWQHSIPKSKSEMKARINLTFRKIL